jgi:acetyltransferase-like isoleucine patch superfamily enzyme
VGAIVGVGGGGVKVGAGTAGGSGVRVGRIGADGSSVEVDAGTIGAGADAQLISKMINIAEVMRCLIVGMLEL